MKLTHVGNFHGYKIILSEGEIPKKIHIKNDNMSDAYHKRIQKKWNKRYGFIDSIEEGKVIVDDNEKIMVMNRQTFHKNITKLGHKK